MQQNAPAKLRYTVPRKNVHNLNVVSHEETEHVFAIFWFTISQNSYFLYVYIISDLGHVYLLSFGICHVTIITISIITTTTTFPSVL